jgi:hypothetical protein
MASLWESARMNATASTYAVGFPDDDILTSFWKWEPEATA